MGKALKAAQNRGDVRAFDPREPRCQRRGAGVERGRSGHHVVHQDHVQALDQAGRFARSAWRQAEHGGVDLLASGLDGEGGLTQRSRGAHTVDGGHRLVDHVDGELRSAGVGLEKLVQLKTSVRQAASVVNRKFVT